MTLKLYTYPGNKNAYKALIAAQYVGVRIEVPPFSMGETNKTPEFLKLNPNGKACPLFMLLYVFLERTVTLLVFFRLSHLASQFAA